MKSLVSIIIPTYNRAYILGRAVRSVFEQSYENLEVLIVDDGSTDNTSDIIRDFKDSRLRFFHDSQNKGRAYALNIGIRNSKGNFLAILDSDDEYLPQKIKKSLIILENSLINFDLVASNYYVIKRDKSKTLGIKKPYQKKRIFPSSSSWVLKKGVFEKIGFFDERLLLTQDVDFFHRFLKKFDFHLIDEPLLNIYQMKDGAFSDMNKVIEIRKKYMENLKNDKPIYAQHLSYLGKDYLRVGQNKNARECFLKAFYAYPRNFRYLLKYLKTYRRSK